MSATIPATDRPRKPSGRTASKGVPNAIDVYVGQRIRLRRTLIGMSQEGLAIGIGTTFQQVQKYERGMNRVSASRMVDLARALQVEPGYFFADMSPEVLAQSPARVLDGTAPALAEAEADPATSRRCLELVRYFTSIKSERLQSTIYQVVKAAAGANGIREVR